MSKLISIVIPMYNEEDNVDAALDRMGDVAREIRDRWQFRTEVIVNDNASMDGTSERLKAYRRNEEVLPFRLRGYRFARNVGFQKSILFGFCKAEGDAVVQIDADLQDPPELILEFIGKWLEGYHVVFGVRRSRQEGRLINGARWLFYRGLNRISSDALPHDSGDFRLVDRRFVDIVRAIEDQDPYLRGLIASLGGRQIGVAYDRGERQAGESKFGMRDLLRLSIDAVSNHSVLPLRLASYIAFAIVIAMIVLSLFYLGTWAVTGDRLPAGFTTQVLLQLGATSVLAALLGLQGEFIARIYKQLKQRPIAVVESSFETDRATGQLERRDDVVEPLWSGSTD